MTKDKESKGDKNIQVVEEALSKTEHFIEKNQKIIMYVIASIIVIIGGYMAFQKFYVGPREKEAEAQMFNAEKYFEKDSLKLALNGDGNNLGFLDIIDEYSITKSADLAHYYAGICYLKLGQYEEAIEQLEKFDGDDQIVSSMAIGAIGDAHMELGDNEQALKYYLKAVDNSNNLFTAPLFLMKAGLTYEVMGKYEDAKKIYERIQKDYYRSFESREIEKYISRAKGMLGEKES